MTEETIALPTVEEMFDRAALYHQCNHETFHEDCGFCRFDKSVLDAIKKAARIDDNEWKPWGGGACPVKNLIQVKSRDGEIRVGDAINFDWNHEGDGDDIVAYRDPRPLTKEEAA